MVNAGFETGDFTGWSIVEESDSVSISECDEFARPQWGNYMAVLGTPAAEEQPKGPNTISQSFTAASDYLIFAYKVCTQEEDDYYDYFSYDVEVVADSTIIAHYEIAPYNASPYWEYIMIDISPYVGTDITLSVSAGGTIDNIVPTWAYFDAMEADL